MTNNLKYFPGLNGSSFKFVYIFIAILFLGYAITLNNLNGFVAYYLFATLLCSFSIILLFTKLNLTPRHTLPFWIIFLLFFTSYFIKFYILVFNPNLLDMSWVNNNLYIALRYPSITYESFITTSCGFIAFCVTAWWLLIVSPGRNIFNKPFNHKNDFDSPISVLRIIIPLLIVITSFIAYRYNIGLMGLAGSDLSFRFAGWIFYVRSTLLPALIILLIWCANNNKKYFVFGFLLLFLHGFSNMLLYSSRGALFLLFFQVITLFCLAGKINIKHVYLFVFIFIATVFLYPIITIYRYIRIANPDISIFDSFLATANGVINLNLSEFLGLMGRAIFSIFMRFTGIDSIINIMFANHPPLYYDIFNIPFSISKFYTLYIVGFPVESIHSSAPSFLGWLYIVGGNYLVIFGVFLFTVLFWQFWLFLEKLNLRSLPVSKVIFIFFIFGIFSEGTLGNAYLLFLVTVGSIFICELIMRIRINLTL